MSEEIMKIEKKKSQTQTRLKKNFRKEFNKELCCKKPKAIIK